MRAPQPGEGRDGAAPAVAVVASPPNGVPREIALEGHPDGWLVPRGRAKMRPLSAPARLRFPAR
ncbi:hypothetical protein GCM10009817_19080 [Terrabacter lapilli]|uniref:Uncharacterized protein n=1 Tax=Terrabacter lapilli TaxID=436231 RepID=A0ABN2S1P5_9MICO